MLKKLCSYTYFLILSCLCIQACGQNQTLAQSSAIKAYSVFEPFIQVTALQTLIASYLPQQPTCIKNDSLIRRTPVPYFSLDDAVISLASTRYFICSQQRQLLTCTLKPLGNFDLNFVQLPPNNGTYILSCLSENGLYGALVSQNNLGTHGINTIFIIDFNKQEPTVIYTIKCNELITNIALSSDGSYLTTITKHHFYLHKKNNKQEYVLSERIEFKNNRPDYVVYSSDMKYIITAQNSLWSENKYKQSHIVIYNNNEGKLSLLETISNDNQSQISALKYNNTHGDIILGFNNGSVIAYSLENNKYKAKNLRIASQNNNNLDIDDVLGTKHDIKAISCSPQGNYLAVALPNNRTIAFWKRTQTGYNQCDYTIPCSDDIIGLVFLDTDTVLLYTGSHSFETWVLPSELHANK
jgi:WD40 repeat protein